MTQTDLDNHVIPITVREQHGVLPKIIHVKLKPSWLHEHVQRNPCKRWIWRCVPRFSESVLLCIACMAAEKANGLLFYLTLILIRTLQHSTATCYTSVTANYRRPNVQLHMHASDSLGSIYQTFIAWDFAAMGSYSFNPHTRFLEHLAEWTVGLHRSNGILSRASTMLTPWPVIQLGIDLLTFRLLD